MTLKLGMQHRVLKYYQVCLNNKPGLTLTYFTARSNLVPYGFVWEKGKPIDFSEAIVVYDLKRIRVVSPTFPFAPESFRPLSLSPRVVSLPGRFAHFPVRT